MKKMTCLIVCFDRRRLETSRGREIEENGDHNKSSQKNVKLGHIWWEWKWKYWVFLFLFNGLIELNALRFPSKEFIEREREEREGIKRNCVVMSRFYWVWEEMESVSPWKIDRLKIRIKIIIVHSFFMTSPTPYK